jgi:uncharacterized circularly permuted ATP-grasp superfamily protein
MEGIGHRAVDSFDIIPRIIPETEWKKLEAGLKQRVKALNLFLGDIYHDQAILNAGIIPREKVVNNAQYRAGMQGVDVPGGIYAHIAGIDIVRRRGRILRAGRQPARALRRFVHAGKPQDDDALVPELFAKQAIAPVEHYPLLLLENLRAVAPAGIANPVVVVLTPGVYNAAYFEHSFSHSKWASNWSRAAICL